eukprot:TRINITY_DN21665_c0_g1_i1.p1 TRINITY_DN21665_c0_g1~~TRINITY_DN21665_c0_g1_i1.p1  ORF type:complete len:600 (-),score=58.96 TRINITY_DN21665_c0_g1_i1:242-1912(-)
MPEQFGAAVSDAHVVPPSRGSQGGTVWEESCALPRTNDACSGKPATEVIQKPISFLTLGVLIFYNVSGGPFGSEVAVGAAGPLCALVGFVLMPFFWSIPCALVTAELATTFPDASGFVSWVSAAFGPFWGFQEGILSWICAATDNAIYPTLFVSYLRYLLCSDDDETCSTLNDPPVWFLPPNRLTFIFLISALLTFCNWRGLELVGKVAGVLTVVMLMPFGLICILGLPNLRFMNWLSLEPAGPEGDRADWFVFFNVLFWNLSSWESASTVAGEVADPSTTFPKSLFFALLLVLAVYILPMAVCTAALPSDLVWKQGFYAEAGFLLGGRALEVGVLVAAAVSNIGMFLSEQVSDAFLLAGMAELGLLPAFLARRNRHGIPSSSLLLTLVVILALSTCKVVNLVEMLNGVNCLALLLQFAAFIKLRVSEPDLPRPYRVPLGTIGCVLMLTLPVAMCMFLIAMPYWSHDWATVAFVQGSMLFGPLLYGALTAFKRISPSSFLCSPMPMSKEETDNQSIQDKGFPVAASENMKGVCADGCGNVATGDADGCCDQQIQGC